MYLQVWNGIQINSTTFGRTVEWRGGGVFGNHSGVKAIIGKKGHMYYLGNGYNSAHGFI